MTSSIGTAIPTVGIVVWSTSLAAPAEAHIDFGLTTSYGMTAPVNVANPAYRTLLLGMKSSHTYHFRVEASAGASQCTSQDYLITTGPLNSAVPAVTLTTYDASALFGGFLLAGDGAAELTRTSPRRRRRRRLVVFTAAIAEPAAYGYELMSGNYACGSTA